MRFASCSHATDCEREPDGAGDVLVASAGAGLKYPSDVGDWDAALQSSEEESVLVRDSKKHRGALVGVHKAGA